MWHGGGVARCMVGALVLFVMAVRQGGGPPTSFIDSAVAVASSNRTRATSYATLRPRWISSAARALQQAVPNERVGGRAPVVVEGGRGKVAIVVQLRACLVAVAVGVLWLWLWLWLWL